MSAEDSSLPEVGDLIGGRFRIVDHLGTGGFGTVYKALQKNIGRDVALKFLTPGVAEDPNNVERFQREAYHVSQLQHHNTITLYDYGQTDNGLFYMVLELLEGISLAETIEEEGALSFSRAAHIFIRVLESLSEAHQRGLVHRDLKPENIYLCEMVGKTDYVKVLDFGVAKMTRGENDPSDDSGVNEDDLTKQGHIFGTPMYMAPEQACDEPITPATDVYALGLLLFEVLTGMPPVTGSSRMDVIHKQIKDPVPEIPEPLEKTAFADVIRRAVKKDEKARFQNAGEFLDAFGAAVREMGVTPAPKGEDGGTTWSAQSARRTSPPPIPGEAPEPVGQQAEQGGTEDSAAPNADEPTETVEVSSEMAPEPADEGNDQQVFRQDAAGLDSSSASAGERTREVDPDELLSDTTSDDQATGGTPHEYGLPLIGRDELLGSLTAEFEKSSQTASGRVVLIEGETGVGKSRVVHELSDRLEDGAQVGFGHFRRQSRPMQGVRELFADLWGVAHRDRAEVEEALRADLASESSFDDDDIEDLADFIRPPSGDDAQVPTSREEAKAMYARLEDMLGRLTSRRPVVMVLEDVHHADSATLSLLEFLSVAMETGQTRLMVVLTLRPDLRGENPELEPSLQRISRQLDDRFLRYPLQPLEGEALSELLDQLCPLEEQLKERIGWLSQGVPLHAMQIIQYLQHENALESDGERMALAEGSPRDIDLPPDLMDLMQLRIQQAAKGSGRSDELRQVLEWLAILGMRTPVDLLVNVIQETGGLSRAALRDVIDILQQEDIVRQRLHRNMVCLEFENSLLRETLLNSIEGKWESRNYNRLAAQEKLAFYRERDAEVPLVEIADHWRKAGEREKYRETLFRSAQRSLKRFDPRVARERYRELLPLLEDKEQRDEIWVQSKLALADLSRRFGEYGMAEAHYQAVANEASASSTRRARALRGLGHLYVVQARYADASEMYRRALELSRNADGGELAGVAKALRGLSQVYLMQGDVQGGAKVRGQLEQMLPKLPEGEISGKILMHLAEAAHRLGRSSERYDFLVRARAQLQKSDDHQALSGALIQLGSALFEPTRNDPDRFERAEELLKEALNLKRRIGDRHGVGEAYRALSRLQIERGNYQQGSDLAEKAVEIHRALGAPMNIGLSYRRLGVARLLLGDVDGANEALDFAVDRLEKTGDQMGVSNVLFAKGVAAMNARDMTSADNLLEDARRLKEQYGTSRDLFDVRNHLAMVSMWFGDYDRAESLLDETMDHVDEYGTPEDHAVARCLMGLLRCFQSRLQLAPLEMGRAKADADKLRTPRIRDFCEAGAGFYAHLTNSRDEYREIASRFRQMSVLNDLQPEVWLEWIERMALDVFEREGGRQAARLVNSAAAMWKAKGRPERASNLRERLTSVDADYDPQNL
jgi:serine/threonine-protein kinase